MKNIGLIDVTKILLQSLYRQQYKGKTKKKMMRSSWNRSKFIPKGGGALALKWNERA